MITELLLKYVFKHDKEIVIMIGSKVQKGSMFVVLTTKKLWDKENGRKKIESILNFNWAPTETDIQISAKDVFMYQIFGGTSDYANELFRIMTLHNSRAWTLDSIQKHDKDRAEALEAMTVLTRMRFNETSNLLHLNLNNDFPFICILAHPMVLKIPIVSFQYFLNIHSTFAFNSIRQAKHPQADGLISYLYEVLFLQQKIAISLHEYFRLVAFSENQKNNALFINAEINAIMSADLVFSYLKASIEKIIVIIGLTHGILNLDSKKTHKLKLEALNKGLPKEVANLDYVRFTLDFISSENLDELNSYRSGLLHKKGISDLQPHNYVGKRAESVPLRKIFQILLEQHSKNTAILIGALAMLTDELVKLDPPNISLDEVQY